MITSQLVKMRESGLPLNLTTIRGIMVALIEREAPQLFLLKNAKGESFRCTDAFVRHFLDTKMDWTWRCATKAAQKVPNNAPQVTVKAFLRMSCSVRDENISPHFIINADQTGIVYAQGTSRTYAERGAKQVAVVGTEEKRAFTLMVTLAQSGQLLPFQAIYSGKDPRRSLPKPSSPGYNDAIAFGIRFEVSGNESHWATQASMQNWMNFIVVPYFEDQKRTHHAPPSQRCIAYIDCWSVHRSLEFRTWLAVTYPWVYLQYCPAGCTGLFQPADALPQRVIKNAIKASSHSDIVNETLALLESGVEPGTIVLDKTVGTLRDRSPRWLLAAREALMRPGVILKVSLSVLLCELFRLKQYVPFRLGSFVGPDPSISPVSLSAVRRLIKLYSPFARPIQSSIRKLCWVSQKTPSPLEPRRLIHKPTLNWNSLVTSPQHRLMATTKPLTFHLRATLMKMPWLSMQPLLNPNPMQTTPTPMATTTRTYHHSRLPWPLQ